MLGDPLVYKKEPATHIEAQHVYVDASPRAIALMLHSLPCGCPTMPHLLVTHTLFWSDSGHQLVYQVRNELSERLGEL
jgi:hypothetical protein